MGSFSIPVGAFPTAVAVLKFKVGHYQVAGAAPMFSRLVPGSSPGRPTLLDGSWSHACNVTAMKTGSPIACNLGALDEAQREPPELAAHLQSSVREIVPNA